MKIQTNPKWIDGGVGQWITVGYGQLGYNMTANISILLREHSLLGTSLIVVFYVSVLGWVFREGGGIQKLFKVNLPPSLSE